jgi:glycerol-3-phosphate dehydrogenase
MGIGLQSPWGPDRDPVCGGGRFMFMVPWKQSTLLGTSYQVHRGSAHERPVREEHLQAVVDEFNDASPDLALSLNEITWYHWGLVPLKAAQERGRAEALSERSRVIDHEADDGRRGLVSLRSVKYTTARRLAERGIDLVQVKLGSTGSSDRHPGAHAAEGRMCGTDAVPRTADRQAELAPGAYERLAAAYGGAWPDVVATGAGDAALRQPLSPGTAVLGCEVLYAATHEMAVELADVVFRRTDLGTERCPDTDALAAAARIMGQRLGWTADRQAADIDAVLAAYRPLPCAQPALPDPVNLGTRRETA